MRPDRKDDNAKDPHWQVPVDLPGVKPGQYDADIDSGRGSAHHSPVGPSGREDPLKKEEEKRGQYPLRHDPIGGA